MKKPYQNTPTSQRGRVRVTCTLLSETPAAIRVEQDGVAVWVPRSQLMHISKKPVGENGRQIAEVDMPRWLAEAKELEGEEIE